MTIQDRFIVICTALILLLTVAIISPLSADENKILDATCWSEDFNSQPCKLETKSDRIWLLTQGWTDIFFISDTYKTDNGKLLVLLLRKDK